MQVVYSGGSTPSPSPRLSRKTGYGRPIIPGYMTHVHPHILVQRSREKLTEGDTTLRDSIPAMSKCTAVICLILNIILPGSGTLTAGLSVLCCSRVRPKEDSKAHCILVNAGVALLQFLLTFLFLLGWIWSIMWGMAFLSVSQRYFYRQHNGEERKQSRDAEKANKQNPHKTKQVNEAINSASKKPQCKHTNMHDHHHDSHHQEQCHHYLEHYRRQTVKESAADNPYLNVVDYATYNTESVQRHGSKHNCLGVCNRYSPVSDEYQYEPDLSPRQPITESDTSILLSDSSGAQMASQTFSQADRFIRQPNVNGNDTSRLHVTQQQFQSLHNQGLLIHDDLDLSENSQNTREAMITF